MELLEPTRFASMCVTSKKEFKEISNIITKYFDASTAEDFLDTSSFNKLDFKTANNILDDLMYRITGHNTNESISIFVDKYKSIPGLAAEVSEQTFESNKVKVICKYKKQIMNEIDKKYNKK